MHEERRDETCPRVQVFVFDLLALDGADLRGRPLRERKALLGRVLGAGDAVLKPVHFIEGAPELLVKSAKELGFEGVIAKYTGAPYQGGPPHSGRSWSYGRRGKAGG